MSSAPAPIDLIRARIATAAGPRPVQLLAVSKTRGADEIRALAGQGQRDFGENYVQEALAKMPALADLGLSWHLIGHLQSNKCREAASAFDWIDSVDRLKLVEPLDRYRPPERPPLNVLVQVNIDDEDSKTGCAPGQVDSIADAIVARPRLRLRGLMAIPAPGDRDRLALAFGRMRDLFDQLQQRHPQLDTLSMGMSDDFDLAIAHGATCVRIGTALFGPRTPPRSG